MAFILFSASFFDESHQQMMACTQSGFDISGDYERHSFYLSGINKEPEQVFSDVEILLEHFQANLYAGAYAEDGTYTRLVYCTRPEALQSISLESGRFFGSDENRSLFFLSTKKTERTEQIGLLSRFDYDYSIRTIYSEINHDVFGRELTLLLPEAGQFSQFKEALRGLGYDLEEVPAANDVTKGQNDYYLGIKILTLAVSLLIMTFMIIYHVINSYRNMGIRKMLGIGIFSIWKEQMLPLILGELTITLCGLCLAYFFLFKAWTKLTRAFLFGQLVLFLSVILFTAFLSVLPYLYIRLIRISDVIKNHRPASLAIAINSGIKIGLLVIVLGAACSVYSEYRNLQTHFDLAYSKWEETKSLALIRYAVTYNERYDPWDDEYKSGFRDAYQEFNRRGAIFADFENYEKLEDDNSLEKYQECAIVNRNYIIHNPVKDEEGNPVSIPDSEDIYLLVPAQYKSFQQEIIRYHQSDLREEQQIQILWIQDGQSFFTYRMDIEAETGNRVKDPMIYIMPDQKGIWYGNIASGYLLIPVQDTVDPSREVNEIMGRYFDSAQVNFKAVSVYATVNEQIQTSLRNSILLGLLMLVLFGLASFVMIQNANTYFEQNNLRLAVQHCMGFRFWDRYQELLLIFLGTSVLELTIAGMIWQLPLALWIGLLVAGMELIILYVFLRINEGKKVLRTLKGG